MKLTLENCRNAGKLINNPSIGISVYNRYNSISKKEKSPWDIIYSVCSIIKDSYTSRLFIAHLDISDENEIDVLHNLLSFSNYDLEYQYDTFISYPQSRFLENIIQELSLLLYSTGNYKNIEEVKENITKDLEVNPISKIPIQDPWTILTLIHKNLILGNTNNHISHKMCKVLEKGENIDPNVPITIQYEYSFVLYWLMPIFLNYYERTGRYY